MDIVKNKLKDHWYCALWKGKLCVNYIYTVGGGGGGARGMGGVKTSWEGNGKAKSHCNQKPSSRWTAETQADSWACALGQKAGVFESLSGRVPDYIIIQLAVSLQEKPFIYTSLSGICSL